MRKLMAVMVVMIVTLVAIGWINVTCISALANDEVVIYEVM